MTHSLIHPNSPLDQVKRRETRSIRSAPATLAPRDRAELAEILAEEPDYVDNELFERDDAREQVFDQTPNIPSPNTSWYHPIMQNASEGHDVRGVVNVVLDKHQEKALFLQYNYARYRLAKLREQIGDQAINDEQARQLLYWRRQARQIRDRIAQFNLALVLAMAKRVRGTDLDFADLISEGNMALLRAIDKFDVSKGFKFSTYACRAILKAFSRHGVKHTQYKSMFPTDFDPALEKSDYQQRKNADHEDDCATEVRRIVQHNSAELTDVEQAVIEHRFALNESDAPPLTLEQVGKLVGLTKERVRQIQNKALTKIRHTLESSYLDGPHAAAPEDGDEAEGQTEPSSEPTEAQQEA